MNLIIKTPEYKEKLDKAFKELERFLRKILREKPSSSDELPGVSFHVPGLGEIELRGKTAEEYAACVKQIISVLSARKDIDARSVEASIQIAILKTISNHTVESVISDLRELLYMEPYELEVYQPVIGIDKEGLPATVGKIKFVYLNDNLISALISREEQILRNRQIVNPQVATAITKENLRKLKGAALAYSRVLATDHNAARSAAESHLREVIHVINCYSSLIYSCRSGVFMLGDGGGALSTTPVFSEGGTSSWSELIEWRGCFIPVKLTQILGERGNRKGFHRANQILASENRSSIDNRILGAFHWSGRASVEQSREVAFLFYMIALESLLLGNRDKGDLGFRLKTRCAFLLASDLQSRIKIASQVKSFYQIRSALAHAGSSRNITDADISLLEKYVKTCLARILMDSPFTQFNSEEHLDTWFDHETLK